MNRRLDNVLHLSYNKLSDAAIRRYKSEEERIKRSKALKGKNWKVVDGKRVWY